MIGVDNLPAAALADPRLTTIAINAAVPATAVAARILTEAGIKTAVPMPQDPALRLIDGMTT